MINLFIDMHPTDELNDINDTIEKYQKDIKNFTEKMIKITFYGRKTEKSSDGLASNGPHSNLRRT